MKMCGRSHGAQRDLTMSALHEFDFALCEYVRGNFPPCLREPFIEAGVSQLPRVFADYLRARLRLDGPPESESYFLLNDEELSRLQSIALTSPTSWRSIREVHDDATKCTREIRQELSPEDAQRWSKRSSRFRNELESSELNVSAGIACIREWLDELRRYKVAIYGTTLLPRPEGGFPTPSHPEPLESDNGGIGGSGSKRHKEPLAASEKVKLFSLGSNPQAIVNGVPKSGLTQKQHKVIETLLKSGANGLTKRQLVHQSGCTDAVNILKRLEDKDDWKQCISLPGGPGRGYRIL
jgi:hypothetical protein